MLSLSDLRRVYRGSTMLGGSLAPFTALRIGGSADYYFEPVSAADTLALVRYLHAHKLPFFEITEGANILVSDEGFHGAAINVGPGCADLRVRERVGSSWLLEVGAGVTIPLLMEYCSELGIATESLRGGCSGTLGRCLLGADASSRRMRKAIVSEAWAVHQGTLVRLNTEELETLPHNRAQTMLFVSATLGLNHESPSDAGAVHEGTTGVAPLSPELFLDPEGVHAETLLRAAGCAGMRLGNVMVPLDRPNSLALLADNVRTSEVLELVRIMQRTVLEHSGYQLSLAMRLVGFNGHPVREVA